MMVIIYGKEGKWSHNILVLGNEYVEAKKATTDIITMNL